MRTFASLRSAARSARASAPWLLASSGVSRQLHAFRTRPLTHGASVAAGWLLRGAGAVAAGAGVGLGLCHLSSGNNSRTAHACGIMAFVSDDERGVGHLLEGLSILSNRGYDSAGIASVDDKGAILVTKHASHGSSTSNCIDLLVAEAPQVHSQATMGIAHTRWATHGGKTDENAHPHMDHKRRVALVHNGTIENVTELKNELLRQGIKFTSETDTEVIAQLVGVYLDKGLPILDAVHQTLDRLQGTWGLAIIHKDHPKQIIAARHGSPLLIGVDNNRMFIASEAAAFGRHTANYIALKDGEVAVVTPNGVDLDMDRVEKAHVEKIELSPAPYAHWTLKEIMEQPEAISRALNFGGRLDVNEQVKLGGMEANASRLLAIRHFVGTGCGTSLFALLYGVKLFRRLRAFDTATAIDAAELSVDDFAVDDQGAMASSGLMAVSQSGETKDTHRAVVVAQALGLTTFSVINQVGSLIARTTGCGVYLNAGREHAVGSTKAFTTQVTAMALLAAWFNQERQTAALSDPTALAPHWNGVLTQRRVELVEALRRLPLCAGQVLRTHEQIKTLAQELVDAKCEHMFVLGKGMSEPIAQEGALKVKELSLIHAEGFSGGALKHGTFALLDQGTPVVMVMPDDEHMQLMKIAAQEVKSRGAHVIVITDNPHLVQDVVSRPQDVIAIPSNGLLTSLEAVIPLQLMAYELAVKKGINPDKPRHLAKAVTVD